jgi:pyridoxal biosynthesis lyase PdxS
MARATAAARPVGRFAGTIATPANAGALRAMGMTFFLVGATAVITQALRASAKDMRAATG